MHATQGLQILPDEKSTGLASPPFGGRREQALHCTHSELHITLDSHSSHASGMVNNASLLVPASSHPCHASLGRCRPGWNSASQTEPCGVLVRHAKGGGFHSVGLPELTLKAVSRGRDASLVQPALRLLPLVTLSVRDRSATPREPCERLAAPALESLPHPDPNPTLTQILRTRLPELALDAVARARGARLVQPAPRLHTNPNPTLTLAQRPCACLPELALDAVPGRRGARLVQPAPRLLHQVPAAGHGLVGKHHGPHRRAALLPDPLPVRLRHVSKNQLSSRHATAATSV